MITKNGNRPQNARIKISFPQGKDSKSNLKPKISFSYPAGNHGHQGSMLYYIFIGWAFLMIFVLLGYDLAGGVTNWISQVVTVVSLFGVPCLIYFPFKKQWNRLYPRWTAFKALKKLKNFYPEDVVENEKRPYVELPVFQNIICDFQATKDFSKYMEEFEIREHSFVYQLRKKVKVKDRKTGKIKYKRIHKENEYIWYARWYFVQKPKTGEINVLFK